MNKDGRFKKEVAIKSDGRYVIFYDFSLGQSESKEFNLHQDTILHQVEERK